MRNGKFGWRIVRPLNTRALGEIFRKSNVSPGILEARLDAKSTCLLVNGTRSEGPKSKCHGRVHIHMAGFFLPNQVDINPS